MNIKAGVRLIRGLSVTKLASASTYRIRVIIVFTILYLKLINSALLCFYYYYYRLFVKCTVYSSPFVSFSHCGCVTVFTNTSFSREFESYGDMISMMY